MRLKAGIYLITDRGYKKHGPLRTCFAELLQAGVSALQYRDQSNNRRQRWWEAVALRDLCYQAGVPFIVNNDLDLAQAIDADGVHLGQQDVPIPVARKKLARRALIGVSCHNSLRWAQQAELQGADYVSFGALFRSPTKPRATRVTIAQVARYRRQLNKPVLVIGGIGLANLQQAIRSQADLIAIISDIAQAKNPRVQLMRCLRIL